MAVSWSGGLPGRSGALRTMLPDPALNVPGLPDLAHPEHGHGRREVGTRDDLLYALTTDAEERSDLGRPHQVVHGGQHSHDDSCRLTMGQEYGRLVV